MKKLILLLGVAVLSICSSANATILLNLTDSSQGNTPYMLSFVAAYTTTTLNVAGYQTTTEEEALNNGVFASGSATNLLGQTWDFTPAPLGSNAAQAYNLTPVNFLIFAGMDVGNYDTFSQTFATTVGETYTYDFNLVEISNESSGFEVYANVAAVPEPGVWALMLAGLSGLGAAVRLSRRNHLGALAAS